MPISKSKSAANSDQGLQLSLVRLARIQFPLDEAFHVSFLAGL